MEVVQSGLATHLVPSAKLPQLQTALCQLGPQAGDSRAVAETIASHQVFAQSYRSPVSFSLPLLPWSSFEAFDSSLVAALKESQGSWCYDEARLTTVLHRMPPPRSQPQTQQACCSTCQPSTSALRTTRWRRSMQPWRPGGTTGRIAP